MQRIILAASLTLLAACSVTQEQPATLPQGQIHGEAIQPQALVDFATVDANPSEYFERTVLVEATGVAVCQKAGCWMKIEDEGKTAMVRWETGCGGKYKFPEDAVGKRIVIQGSFYPKTISPEDAEHMREEAGDEALEIPLEGYEFNASAMIVIG